MPVRKYLNAKELKRLLDHDFGWPDNLIFQMGISCGLRSSEMVNIRIVNIGEDGMTVWDEKKDRYRDIALDTVLWEMIGKYIDDEYIPRHGVRMRDRKLFDFSTKTLNRKVKRAFEEMEITTPPARWHTFRHTYIRLMLDKLGDRAIQYICLQTGDTPQTILKHYAIPSFEDRARVAENLRVHINYGWYA